MSKLVEIKVASVMAVSMILHTLDLKKVEATLHDLTGGSSDFFDKDFVVVDLAPLVDFPGSIQWKELIKIIKRFNLHPVAVRHAPSGMVDAIIKAGLAIDHGQPTREKEALPASLEGGGIAPDQNPGAFRRPMIIDTPVRAGQRIYARGCDLVVTAVVNNGAEVIADGSIHIYAPLRGRALAGANGDPTARIFAHVMEPELVSISGVYRTFENGFSPNWAKKTAQVRLDGESIYVEPLDAISKS